MKKVLILCTGNSCRSKMAQAFLQSIAPKLCVRSAGTQPAPCVHPMAVEVMSEAGYPIADLHPHNVFEYMTEDWDYVITVCNQAQESCPTFSGQVLYRVHLGFRDPASATGTEADRRAVFREVRNQIIHSFSAFYNQYILEEDESEERL